MGVCFRLVQNLTKIVCISAAVLLVGMWIFIYKLDKDSITVESKEYFGADDDVFPVMSLCFNQFFDDRLFERYGGNITAEAYKSFLFGYHYDDKLTKINFHEVTTNLSDFIIKYEVGFRNSTFVDTQENIAWKPLYYTFSWNSWGMFLKCFGLEITDKNLYHVRIFINREIFKNNVNYLAGGLATLFHYPNQIMSSLQTVKRQWLVWDNSTNHFLSFNIKGMEADISRYKEDKHNCIEDWKNYDNITMENHMKTIGCKSPDQITNSDWPICSSKEMMRKARIPLNNEKLRPCRRVESVHFELGETQDTGYHNMENDSNWFCIVVRILNPRFKETVQQKEVDIQTLIGYIGGYIGILTGFAIIQIPEMLMEMFKYSRMFIR